MNFSEEAFVNRFIEKSPSGSPFLTMFPIAVTDAFQSTVGVEIFFDGFVSL